MDPSDAIDSTVGAPPLNGCLLEVDRRVEHNAPSHREREFAKSGGDRDGNKQANSDVTNECADEMTGHDPRIGGWSKHENDN